MQGSAWSSPSPLPRNDARCTGARALQVAARFESLDLTALGQEQPYAPLPPEGKGRRGVFLSTPLEDTSTWQTSTSWTKWRRVTIYKKKKLLLLSSWVRRSCSSLVFSCISFFLFFFFPLVSPTIILGWAPGGKSCGGWLECPTAFSVVSCSFAGFPLMPRQQSKTPLGVEGVNGVAGIADSFNGYHDGMMMTPSGVAWSEGRLGKDGLSATMEEIASALPIPCPAMALISLPYDSGIHSRYLRTDCRSLRPPECKRRQSTILNPRSSEGSYCMVVGRG
ncbi:hypothetical protein MAPG_02275 [Magnaporthiopsis poae ATCC 64411]|uniref:Uncharacterized protein n=1 Tax=Magnaporthiopsis poae (strain ATCC 64411 / 73-15) TaxID=644358 RepID=A0A0C4DQX7_MAGP6|nr:hypothetical protein MAPG_02275 [Magnaporthiopsis poae ATCC 64411]